ncbi:hypothetical protein [Vibrio sp. Hal054]|uniref:hypothetical protein n=1 Tax=Vibrio sp. Hal054 TaxID=3035158 RepID=UPI00301DDBA1
MFHMSRSASVAKIAYFTLGLGISVTAQAVTLGGLDQTYDKLGLEIEKKATSITTNDLKSYDEIYTSVYTPPVMTNHDDSEGMRNGGGSVTSSPNSGGSDLNSAVGVNCATSATYASLCQIIRSYTDTKVSSVASSAANNKMGSWVQIGLNRYGTDYGVQVNEPPKGSCVVGQKAHRTFSQDSESGGARYSYTQYECR